MPGLARGYDTNYRIFSAVAVTDHEYPQDEAHAEEDEAVLVLRMVRIEKANRALIQEDRLRLLKRDAMLTFVLAALRAIPFEAQLIHMYTVLIIG